MDKIRLFDLETDLWEACNLSCAQCTHSSPFFSKDDELYNIEQFKTDIDDLSRIVTIDAMRIVGGEPLLNKNLLSYVKHIKESNITKYLTIFTNGLVLSHTNNDIFPYIDRLRISVYSNIEKNKIDLIYKNIERIKSMFPHLDIIANEITYFSYFNLTQKNNDQETVQKIYDKCYYSYDHRGFSIFNGRFFKCFASRKKYKYLLNHSTENNFDHLKDNLHDSIALQNLCVADFKAFINNKTALEGCKWCLGTCGSQLQHTQLKGKADVQATIEHLNFDEGEKYLSNLLLSWDKQRNYIDHDKFFYPEHIEHYKKHF